MITDVDTMPRWQVIEGDCIEAMRSVPDASVNAIVTDPPYCSGGFSEASRRQAIGQGLRSKNLRKDGWFTGDNMGTSGLVWLLRTVAFESIRLLKPGGSLCVFCDWRMVTNLAPCIESAGFRFQNLVVWNKGSMGLGVGFRAQHELVLHFVTSTGVFHDNTIGNVLEAGRIHSIKRQHQTQKPVKLLQQICKVVAPAEGLVFDPFCGSGSTGVAALKEGMRFIGIERDPAYCAIARNRLGARGATYAGSQMRAAENQAGHA